MGTKVIDAPDFVPFDSLPHLDTSLTVVKAYAHLARTGRIAFWVDLGRSRYFVKGNELLETLLANETRETVGTVMGSTLSEVLLDPRMKTTHLQLLNIEPDTTPEALPESDSAVAFLVSRDNRSLGWFLNQKSLFNPATRRPRFICELGHQNPDPDHGTCYQCPKKIVTVRLE